MNDDLSSLQAKKNPVPACYALKVVLACEDYSAGMWALDVFDRVFPLPDDGLPSPAAAAAQSIWKFELLNVPALRKSAVQEAGRADMIIVSAHQTRDLPKAVHSWAEEWTRLRASGSGALVLLLDEAADGEMPLPPAEIYLRQCATRAKMDFFVHKNPGRNGFANFEVATNLRRSPGKFGSMRGGWVPPVINPRLAGVAAGGL